MTWLDNLERLKGLFDSGALTEDEYNTQKALILQNSQPTQDSPAKPTPDPNAVTELIEPPAPDYLKKIGSYIATKELQTEDTGVLYLGRHESDETYRQQGEVHIKVINEEFVNIPAYKKLLIKGAQEAQSLEHTGLSRILEVVSDDSQLALVSEQHDGVKLADKIGQDFGPMPYEEAYGLFDKVLDACIYAHAKGVIHRRLNPNDIIILANDDIKINNMGVCQFPPGPSKPTPQLSQTHHYLAPEQYRNPMIADHRSDVYSLALLFFEMLTGRLPWKYTMEMPQILRMKKRGKFQQPSTFHPELPERFNRLISAALLSEPSSRYPSVSKFKNALTKTMLNIEKENAQKKEEEKKESEETKTEEQKPAAEDSKTGLFVGIVGIAICLAGMLTMSPIPWIIAAIVILLFLLVWQNRNTVKYTIASIAQTQHSSPEGDGSGQKVIITDDEPIRRKKKSSFEFEDSPKKSSFSFEFEDKPRNREKKRAYAEEESDEDEFEYAGFWIRCVAFFIDAFLLNIPLTILEVMIITNPMDLESQAIYLGVNQFIGIWYFVGMHASSKQATLGKMAMGLQVVDLEGNRITSGTAFLRYLAWGFVLGLTCGIGLIMAGFTQNKQGLHDLLVKTKVIKVR